MEDTPKIIIIGAGAAGFFCALNLGQLLRKNKQKAHITILEKGRSGLRKVQISGGGRCNVTHHEPDHKRFLEHYPRGQRQLRTPYYDFSAADTVTWFQERGVKLKVESDGRMFPVTDSSQTIIDCFQKEAQQLGIEIYYSTKILNLEKRDQQFIIHTQNGERSADYLCIATGSDYSGHDLAKSLGHHISELAPSLFTFKVKDPLLKGLEGTSFAKASVKILDLKNLSENGPMLITHWGLSGPAILKISAWGARELKALRYRFKFKVNFTQQNFDQVKERINHYRAKNLKKQLASQNPISEITQNFWEQLLSTLELDPKTQWANLSQKEINRLCLSLTEYTFESLGPHRHKDEFVECGGIESREIEFKSMASKIVENLYFAGEILDIDGVTGGFNFQNAWSTSFLVANSIWNNILYSQN